ncbi:MAG: 6-phosphogluconolactonase, partial [Chloroflexi bacterium]|nr:6-phosphogluconolactonase [Chloroflexota bacterium]
EAVDARGRFLATLSGGQTPLRSYRLLGVEPHKSSIPWNGVHVFWGDERYVPAGHPESNYGQATAAFLNRVAIPQENVHPVPTDKPSSAEAARAYARLLASMAELGQPGPLFDLVLLGLGRDGHTASLFPGQSGLWSQPVLAVRGDYAGRPDERITLTPESLNRAREIIFLVSGEDKAEAVAAARNSNASPQEFPANAIRPPTGRLVWMLDEAAARFIDSHVP